VEMKYSIWMDDIQCLKTFLITFCGIFLDGNLLSPFPVQLLGEYESTVLDIIKICLSF